MTPPRVLTRRITGIETEYGITYTADGQRRLSPDDIARYLFRSVVDRYGSSNIFTSNGSRLYLDVGSHPEFATAECDSLIQLLTMDKAGDRILDNLAQHAETTLATEGTAAAADGHVYLLKNNVDSFGNSYGCHENYLVTRQTVVKTLGRHLLPFLITRQLISGAGKIYHPIPGSPSEHYGLGFCMSQRADHVWEGVSSATTRSRPIINTRDEPHADSHHYRRLHIIVGDSSMAEPTFALKIGATLLVLEMIEADIPLPGLELADETTAIRDIARDTTGTCLVKLRNGTTITAGEIQRAYCDAAHTWMQQRPVDANTDTFGSVVDLWTRTLDAIDTQDFSHVDRDIDWVIKHSLIRRYQERYGFDLDHPKLAQIDLMYHDIRPGRGLASILESKGLINRWTTDDAITHATEHAPDTTRAHLRSRFIAAAHETNTPFSVDWMRLKITAPEPQLVELGDPFAAVDTRVDELINHMHKGHNSGEK